MNLRLLSRALLLPFILWWCATQAAANTGDKPPDIFLITIDTLRADHVGCYGYNKIQTPALDRLAQEGVRFTAAFTPSPITNSSHASILTGQVPSVHGVTDFGVPLTPATPTLASLLKQRGYRTAAFIGAAILDSNTLAPGFQQGFDYYDNFPRHPEGKSRWGRVERRGMEVVERAAAWIRTHPGRPMFVWVHLYDPHDPYDPPPPFSTLYAGRLYDGEIAYADSALASFLSFLEKQKLYEPALIVVTGDHGEGLGEHQENTHGIFLYDSTLHVPLIIRLPDAEAKGRVLDAQVRTIDIAPTVLETVGVAATGMEGRSLRGLMRHPEDASRPLFAETDYPLRFGWAPLRVMRQEESKFIEAPRPELYDLAHDRGETKNLYEPWNETVQRMRAELAKRPRKKPGAAAAVPASTIAELQALGYLGTNPGSTNVPEPSLLPDPKDKVEVQNHMHDALLADEDHDLPRARENLQKALQLDGDFVPALVGLGRVELQSEHWQQAIELLNRAGKLEPANAEAAKYLGEALEKKGDLKAAAEALSNAVKLNPTDVEAHIALGNVMERMGNRQAAADQFEAAVLLDPQNSAAQAGLKRVRAKTKTR